MHSTRTTLISLLILILILSVSAAAEDWFSNDDNLLDLARLAPSNSVLFVGVDLSRTLTAEEMTSGLKAWIRKMGGQQAVAEMERELGPVDELADVLGTRAMIAVKEPDKGSPELVFALEVKKPEEAVRLLKAVGFIPNRDITQTVTVKGSTFSFIGKGGYGSYGDYLVISNSPHALQSTLGDDLSLYSEEAFRQHISRIEVEQGILFYGTPPSDLIRYLSEMENLSHLLAGLGVSEDKFLGQIYAILNADGSLSRALLSPAGVLHGEAARYVPNDWGFLFSFDLGYVQHFMERLQEDSPELARGLMSEREDIEKEFGVTLEELLKVVDGEVSISSNGLQILPSYYLSTNPSHLDYRLTVCMPLRDVYGARSLLKGAWDRLGLDTEKLPDGVVDVSGVELCYNIDSGSRLLIMSYGPNAVSALRECLALREGESLGSQPGLSSSFPAHNAIVAAYADLRPLAREASGYQKFSALQSVLLKENSALDGSLKLTVEEDGLQATSTGAMPALTGAGAGFIYYLLGGKM